MPDTTTTPAIDLTPRTATRDDAQVMLQLATLGTNPAYDRGMALLTTTDEPLTYEAFNASYPKGSPDRAAVMNVLRWHETVGTLVKNGLFDRALAYDWLLVYGVWDRCAPIANGQRAEYGEPALWENFESLAEIQRAQDAG